MTDVDGLTHPIKLLSFQDNMCQPPFVVCKDAPKPKVASTPEEYDLTGSEFTTFRIVETGIFSFNGALLVRSASGSLVYPEFLPIRGT